MFQVPMMSMEVVGPSNNGNVQRDDDYRKRILQSEWWFPVHLQQCQKQSYEKKIKH